MSKYVYTVNHKVIPNYIKKRNSNEIVASSSILWKTNGNKKQTEAARTQHGS